MRDVLIFLSRGDEEFNDGHTLTSRTQGFNSLSIRTSNP